MYFVAIKNGPSARREEGAYLNRYATDEQRSRRPIFIATLWAGASWLFFRVARALKNSQLTCGETYAYFGDRTLVWQTLRKQKALNRPDGSALGNGLTRCS
jgi:hypothetical protein